MKIIELQIQSVVHGDGKHAMVTGGKWFQKLNLINITAFGPNN